MDLGTCVLDIQSLGWRTPSLYNAFNLLSWFASARAHSGQLGKYEQMTLTMLHLFFSRLALNIESEPRMLILYLCRGNGHKKAWTSTLRVTLWANSYFVFLLFTFSSGLRQRTGLDVWEKLWVLHWSWFMLCSCVFCCVKRGLGLLGFM